MGSWSPRQALRLVFSEADQLSGLIVDRFGDHLVVQVTAAALNPFLSDIVAHLVERLQPASLVTHVDAKTAKSEGMEPHSQCWVGEVPSEPVWLEENGMWWGADLREGQKTGYYLDQCENRWAAARWTPPGARVLDVCTYAGGFALTIANRDPTAQVTAIDSSPRALALAQANAEKNGLDQRVKWEQEDFFHALSARVDAQEVYDMVVLDPPRIAGSRDQLARALSAYHRLNYLAVRLLRPGGILVTCSCSGRVQRVDFLEMLRGVSGRIRREIQVLENRGASPDHPVSIHCPETDYLKCIVARVL
jgi:23S rRNA (cytosine1962-C5)-methyltransferase